MTKALAAWLLLMLGAAPGSTATPAPKHPARLYELDEIHSAFPGVLHLTGGFEKGDLVIRGKSLRTGKESAVRIVWKGLGQDAWTAALSVSEGGRMERAWTMELRRKPGAP